MKSFFLLHLIMLTRAQHYFSSKCNQHWYIYLSNKKDFHIALTFETMEILSIQKANKRKTNKDGGRNSKMECKPEKSEPNCISHE